MNRIKLLLQATYSNVKCKSFNYKNPCNKLTKLYDGFIQNENHLQLPATENSNNQFEGYIGNQWREYIHKRILKSNYYQALENTLNKKTGTNNIYENKCYQLVISNTENFDLKKKERFLSTPTCLRVNNQQTIRYYSTKTKKKAPDDDLLTCKKKSGGCQFHKRTKKVKTEEKCKKAVDKKPKEVDCKKKEQNCSERSLERAKVDENKIPKCPEKKCVEKSKENKLEKNVKERKEQYTKGKFAKKVYEKETCSKGNKPDDNKQIQGKSQSKICKRCFPRNNLHKFKPPPAWKIWLYSLFGVDLTLANEKGKRSCCRIPKEDLQVKWVKLTEYPKPLLDPSKQHSSRSCEERLAVIRPVNTKSDTPKDICTKDDKEFFAQSLPVAKNKAKWAARESDKKDKKKLQPDKGLSEYKMLAVKKSLPEKKTPCSSIDTMQKKTSDFCNTLIALCQKKKQACTKGKTVKKVDVSKHVCPVKKVCKRSSKVKICGPKKPVKKPCNNQLITNEEFEKKRNEGLKMPDRYSCGAGEIERSLISQRKGKIPFTVHFKYREHCKRKPGEEKPTM